MNNYIKLQLKRPYLLPLKALTRERIFQNIDKRIDNKDNQKSLKERKVSI